MNKLKKVEKFGQLIGLTIGAVLTRVLNEHLIGNSLPVSILTLIFVAVIVFCAKLSEKLFSELLDRSSILRRLVASHAYIEGTWLDYADLSSGYYGLISIRYDDGDLTVHGDAYTLHGALDSSWDSAMQKFDGTTLEYLYRATIVGREQVYTEKLGYSKIMFSRDRPLQAPRHFTGSFSDLASTQKICMTRGIRLKRRDVKRLRADASHATKLFRQIGIEICSSPIVAIPESALAPKSNEAGN